MFNRRHQRGVTAIGWLIILGLIAFFALLALRLAPVYLESYKVASALESLKSEAFVTQKTKPEVLKLLMNRFYINDINNVNEKNITIEQASGRMTVSAIYEVRIPIMGNIDAIAKFHKQVELVAN